MKYIRTKDGICEINWFDADDFGDEKGEVHSNCEIIGEANTIEELCDEFVIKDVNGKYAYIRKEKPDILYQNCEIYGAIWTDKGLIFVARMNNEGVLELL